MQGQLKLDSTSSIRTSTNGKLKGLAADSSITGGSIYIADNSSMSIENITLDEILITIGENAKLALQDVILRYDNVASSSTLSLPREAVAHNYSLQGVDVGAANVTGGLTLDVNMMESEFETFNQALAAGSDILFIVQGLEDAHLGDGLIVNLYVNGDSYYATNMGAVGSGLQFSIIPEPSTATLSLLALAGVLSRRRRS